MKPSELFKKTQKFVWAKLSLTAIKWAVLIVLAVIMALIVASTQSETALIVSIIAWLVINSVATYVLEHYVGYLIKAGHVAVIAKAVHTGELTASADMVNVAKEEVKARFASANVYFVIDKLVSGAVKQLQSGVNKIGDLFDRIPAIKMIFSLISMFIGIFLNYVDECCLGWVFVNKEQGAFKSSLDAVVLYFQNAKELAKNAVKIVLLIVGYNVLCWTLCVVALISIPNQVVAIILAAVLFAIFNIVRTSFLDSYVMINIMTAYGEYAKQGEVKVDLYAKLCKLSGKFKELFNKAEEEKVEVATAE